MWMGKIHCVWYLSIPLYHPPLKKSTSQSFGDICFFLLKHKKSGLPDVIFHPISPHLLSNQLASNFLHRISQPL